MLSPINSVKKKSIIQFMLTEKINFFLQSPEPHKIVNSYEYCMKYGPAKMKEAMGPVKPCTNCARSSNSFILHLNK